MESMVNGNILAVRLRQGEKVMPSLEEAVRSDGRRLGIIISGAGMMKSVRLGYFMGKGTYKENLLIEPREIVSAEGNFVNGPGGFHAHVHVGLADDDSRVLGGHLKEALIHGTGEFFIYMCQAEVTRVDDEDTGLKGLKL